MRSGLYRNYLLGMLLLLVVMNYLDRIALGVLLQDIKEDLVLSDTQLGILSGIAFALFYAIMGIPIARWADRGDRVTIISVTAALWSAAVALCGFAGNFAQLLAIRVGVAVGEAGCVPPALSLLGDYFTRAERPRALAIYGLGGPLSQLIGYSLAGWLNQEFGWRVTFVVLGLPGLLAALVAWFTLREPRRHVRKTLAETSNSAPSMKLTARVLWRNATYRNLVLCLSVMFFFLIGAVQWQPAFLIRSHQMDIVSIGVWLALVYGGSGLLGSYLGGELATRFAANREDLQLKAMAGAFVIAGIFALGIYLSPSIAGAFACMALSNVLFMTVAGPLIATVQSIVPDRMRAVASALFYLCANLIGMGFGPVATGVISDALAPHYGSDSLRYALIAMIPGYFWMAWYAYRASKTVMADLAEVGP